MNYSKMLEAIYKELDEVLAEKHDPKTHWSRKRTLKTKWSQLMTQSAFYQGKLKEIEL